MNLNGGRTVTHTNKQTKKGVGRDGGGGGGGTNTLIYRVLPEEEDEDEEEEKEDGREEDGWLVGCLLNVPATC